MATANNPNENRIATVPRNWKTMFGNKNDGDINNMFLVIEAWSPPSIKVLTTDLTNIYNYASSEFLEGFRFFYPRDNIQEQIKHSYSESSSTYSEAIAGFRGGLTKNLTAVVEASTGATGGALTEEPHIFTKSERRSFSINIPLIAYDDLEKDIYAITKFFRKNSYPRRSNDSGGKALLNTIQYPSVFKIRGGLFDTNQPAKGSTFVLEDCTFDYNPNVKSFIKGLPTEVVLTLGFTELNLLFGEDFDATPVNVNIGESGGASTLPSKNKFNEGAIGMRGETALITDVSEYLRKSKLAKRITNLPETIEGKLKDEARSIVQESSLYKKVTALTDNDPVHLAEVKAILGKIRGL
jgi:hypothetical protein